MRVNNQQGVITGMGAGAASGESVRKDELDAGLGGKAERSGTPFTGPVAGTFGAITDPAAGSVVINFAAGQHLRWTIGANRAMGAPIGLTAGQSGVIFITQGTGGNFTINGGSAWGSVFHGPDSASWSIASPAGTRWSIPYLIENATAGQEYILLGNPTRLA